MTGVHGYLAHIIPVQQLVVANDVIKATHSLVTQFYIEPKVTRNLFLKAIK